MKRKEETSRQVGNEGLPLLATLARSADPETSHQAAAAILENVTAQEEAILAALLANPDGLIADQIDALQGWRPTTAGRRLARLLRAGGQGAALVRLDGALCSHERRPRKTQEVKRRTRGNRYAFVHVHRTHLDRWLVPL